MSIVPSFKNEFPASELVCGIGMNKKQILEDPAYLAFLRSVEDVSSRQGLHKMYCIVHRERLRMAFSLTLAFLYICTLLVDLFYILYLH